MVKKLYLLRHAQASSQSEKDFDRPLTPEGERVVRHLAKFLEDKEIEIDRILSSSAIRAMATANILAENLGVVVKPVDELYEASARTFLVTINGIEEKYGKVLIVGHNPTITYLAEYLTNEAFQFETAGLVEMTLSETKWSEVGEKSAEFVAYSSPANYAP